MPRTWRSLPERELHERVAEVEGHESQVRGVVGFFYRMYTTEALKRIGAASGAAILEIGCGEGMMFDGSPVRPVQMDVSLTRLRRFQTPGSRVLCADAYDLPFAADVFQVVLLVAVLEHTRRPARILEEAHRVLRPGGRVIIVVPNDVTLSIGRAALLKWPPRYPDHLVYTTPRKVRRWLAGRFEITEAFPLPFRSLSFFLNLYYVVVAQKGARGRAR